MKILLPLVLISSALAAPARSSGSGFLSSLFGFSTKKVSPPPPAPVRKSAPKSNTVTAPPSTGQSAGTLSAFGINNTFNCLTVTVKGQQTECCPDKSTCTSQSNGYGIAATLTTSELASVCPQVRGYCNQYPGLCETIKQLVNSYYGVKC